VELGFTRAGFIQESIENQLKAILTFAALHGDDVILTEPLYKLSPDRLLDLGGRKSALGLIFYCVQK